MRSKAGGGCPHDRDLPEPLLHLSTSCPLGATKSVAGAKEEVTFPIYVQHFHCVRLNLLPTYTGLVEFMLVEFWDWVLAGTQKEPL